jgi:hypothetical protein
MALTAVAQHSIPQKWWGTINNSETAIDYCASTLTLPKHQPWSMPWQLES